MTYPAIDLPINYIKEFRRCVNKSRHLVLNNDLYRKSWNILCACMDRIEDTAQYLNSKVLGKLPNHSCAFDLMEFLAHVALMLDCIDAITNALGADCKIEPPAPVFNRKIITNQKALNDRVSRMRRTKPYKNEDDLYFEYIRSIGAIHPSGTDRHPYFQLYQQEVSPFLMWNRFVGLTDGDVLLHIYDLNGKSGIHSLKLQVKEIYTYVASRYNRMTVLKEIFCDQVNRLIMDLKSQTLASRKNFHSYDEYLLYLKSEAHKRSEYVECCIEDTRKMIGLDGIPEEVALQYSKYRNALTYAIDDLRKMLQSPLLDDDFDEEILAQELHLPELLREDEKDWTGYCYEKSAKLYDEDLYGVYDIEWSRAQAERLYSDVKEYAFVGKRALSHLNNLQLLAVLNTALYFYSLEHDTFISKRIPKTKRYRLM